MAERTIRIRLSNIREEIAGIRDLTKNASAESFAAITSRFSSLPAASTSALKVSKAFCRCLFTISLCL
jgi:hypothetical protein